MRIKLKYNPVYRVFMSNAYWQFLKDYAGQWLEVETKYLFHDGYNTELFRVKDLDVLEVEGDVRANYAKCNYCGTMLLKDEVCNKHPECEDYGMDYFTPQNTYFLEYPKGGNDIKPSEGYKRPEEENSTAVLKCGYCGRMAVERKFKYLKHELYECPDCGRTDRIIEVGGLTEEAYKAYADGKVIEGTIVIRKVGEE